jgi:hypothetical protein
VEALMPRASSTKTEPAVVDAVPEVAQSEGLDQRDETLRQFKTFRVGSLGKRMGPLDEFMRVQNLPADRVVTWATDPRIDNGRHLAFIKGLGFRPVEVDEVTTDPNVDTKLVVNQFDEGPHRMVCIGGGVLMIGYRQYRDERRKAQREEMQQRVDAESTKLDDMGIEQHAKSRRAYLTEVMK